MNNVAMNIHAHISVWMCFYFPRGGEMEYLGVELRDKHVIVFLLGDSHGQRSLVG